MKESLLQTIDNKLAKKKEKEKTVEVKRQTVEKKKGSEKVSEAYREQEKQETEKKREEVKKTILELQKKSRQKELTPEERKQLQQKYIEQYLPAYLKTQREPAPSQKAVFLFFKLKELLGIFRTKGQEHIPQSGPYLVVSNHFGGETGKLLHMFGKHKIHIMAGTESNWNRSSAREKLLQGLGMLKIDESLAHLSDQQKQELLTRVPQRSRGAYERIIQSEKEGHVPVNIENVRAAVAALVRGEPVAIFPEGLFAYDKKPQFRQAYAGLELICDEYK